MPEKPTKVKLEEAEKKLAQMAAALRKAQAKLKETEENYRMILDGADLMVSVYDLDGICLLMNRKVAGLFGGKPSDFIGKSFSELHPENDKGFWARVKKVVASGKIKRIRLPNPLSKRFALVAYKVLSGGGPGGCHTRRTGHFARYNRTEAHGNDIAGK